MKVWFVQDFTKEIKVYCDINNNSLKHFTISDDTVVEELDKRLITDFSNGYSITEVTLKGRTRALKDIETYYKNKEGVNVKWL